jgi:hypothetical protein
MAILGGIAMVILEKKQAKSARKISAGDSS